MISKNNICFCVSFVCTGMYLIFHLAEIRTHVQKGPKLIWGKIKLNLPPELVTEGPTVKTEGTNTPNMPINKSVTEQEILPADIVNVYNTSNVEIVDTTLCVKTRTPSVFTICTWELHKDKFISGDIHRTGQWEPHITKLIFDILNIEREVTFIDIGANIGYFSLLAASLGQPVLSVEPWEQHVRKFAKSIRINKFEDRITVINNAVSNVRQVVRIDVPRPFNQGAARVISDNENVTANNSFYAKSILLNDLASFVHTTDVVIKIDIEGHECRALEEPHELFDRFKVLYISMEWGIMHEFKNKQGIACPTEYIQNMIGMLTGRGFVPYTLKDELLDANKHQTDIYWKHIPF